MGTACQYPKFFTLLIIYIMAAILAIITGAFLIEASMFPAAILDTFDFDETFASGQSIKGMNKAEKGELKYFQISSLVLGSLTIVFSTFFIWCALELGIVMFCGKNRESYCLFDARVKKEMREIIVNLE